MKRSAALLLTLASPLQGFQSQSLPKLKASHIHCPLQTQGSTSLSLLKGLVPSVDDDINAEIADASLSPLDIFKRELSATDSPMAAMKAVMQRQKDKSGDYENKFKILSDNRSYSDRVLLDKDHVDMAPTLSDLNQKQPQWIKILWSRSYFRFGVFVAAFLVFPILCNVLNMLVKIDPDEFDIINEQFTPGIGILYGTFVALTLDILYERQGKVQENASVEAALLSITTQNILSLFRDEEKIAREATQIIADQVRIIVYRSRGAEMLNIMRSDPYARLMSLLDRYQRTKSSFTPWEEALIDGLRGEIPVLMEARARRLSDEASALPPTHFLVLTLLTALSLIGFTAATVSIQPEGDPPLEARMVFAGLTAIYVLFFNFSNDMNDPFDGVYQIKRSSAASYLLQIKWLVANQRWGRDIRFDTRAAFVPEFDADVLEVTGAGDKRLGSTMKNMENIESTIVGAALVSEAPEKVAVMDVNASSSVDAEVLSSNASKQKAAVMNGTADIGPSSEDSTETYPTNGSLPPSPTIQSITLESQTDGTTDSLIPPPAQDNDAAASTSEASQSNPISNISDDHTSTTQANGSTKKKPISKELNAKDYLPSYFRTLSGFNEDAEYASDAPSITVPSVQPSHENTNISNRDRQTKASIYFRSIGGFMH